MKFIKCLKIKLNFTPTDTRERDIILAAMREIQSKTCFKFTKRTSRQKDYIYILSEKGKGCSSRIGRSGGRQDVHVESLTGKLLDLSY